MGWARRRYGNPDGNQQGIVDLVRDLHASVEITTGVGGGFPDVVIGFQGMTVLCEIKRPGKGKAAIRLRESQEDFLRRWRGGPVIASDSGHDVVNKLVTLNAARGSDVVLAACMDAARGLVKTPADLPALIRSLRGQQ